eukprot:scaffold1328_cov375-Pavlova_lutheri.AAC.15
MADVGASHELRELRDRLCKLHGVKSSKEVLESKTTLFRRVVHLMVAGVDVSELFSAMVLAAAPDEPALKKLLYLYLCTYAKTNPDLALMTVNTLTVDCANEDPTIRRSALRSLCSIGTEELADYLVPPLQAGMRDRSALVRSVAVVGTWKLHRIQPELVEHSGLLEQVQTILQQEMDPQVLANAMAVVDRLDKGHGMHGQAFVYALLNRLSEFSVWGMCTALQVVAKYQPGSEAEMFDIMNILEEPLSSVNSAVFLAAAKVVLCITKDLPHVYQQVLQRIKTPLLTFASGGPPAAQYVALCHVHHLCQLQPMLLNQDFTRLFCRDTDPTYVKLKKMMVLVAIANEQNVYDVVSELNAYTLDAKQVTAVAAVSAIGQIALRNFNATGIVERLLEYIVEGRNHVVSAAVVCVREVFRKYPGAIAGCTEELRSLDCQALDTVEAQAAGLWIMGEYSEYFDNVVGVLDSYMERLDRNLDPRLKCELLVTGMKLFYKDPPQYNSVLQDLIKGTIDDTNPIVKDRALLYYRLLHQPMSSGYEVSIIKIGEQQNPATTMVEDAGEDQDWLNSLQVVSTPTASVL